MVNSYVAQVGLVALLVLANALLAGSEVALISLREGQLRRLTERSPSGRVLAALARDPNRFLATVQIGITLSGFLASATVAVTLATPLIEPMGFLGAAAEPVAILAVTLVLSFLTLVLGELAPKRLAMQRAESWGLLAARPLNALAIVSKPAAWLLGVATDLVVRGLGGDPAARTDDVTIEELRELLAQQRGFSSQQRVIISGAFEIAERRLREIVVPRRDVYTLEAGQTAEPALAALAASGHSRAPVVGPRGLDDVVGVIHIRDLLERQDTAVTELVRPALFLPETLHISDAMRQLRVQRQQMAIVVDEYGPVNGIITMEDLVEEVVGDIQDETDDDLAIVVREPGGVVVLPGGFPIHDLPSLGFAVEPPDGGVYTTVAGMVLAGLGHIPEAPGEVVRTPACTAEVVEVTGHAITRVRLRPPRS